MSTLHIILLIVHLFIAAALVGLVLLQRSEGGALGMGGGGGSLISGRGAGDALGRGTMIFGALFFVTSLTLTMIAGRTGERTSVIDAAPAPAIEQPAPAAEPAPEPVRAAPLDAGADDVAPAPGPDAERAAPVRTAPAPAVAAPQPPQRAPAPAPATQRQVPQSAPPAAAAPVAPESPQTAPVVERPRERAGPDE